MAKKLYVGNLSWGTTSEDLAREFAKAGTVVSADVIKERRDDGTPSDRSKGFGFVEMSTEEEAQAAIAMWNGKELDGRALRVNESLPKTDRPRNGGDFRGGRGNW